MTNTIERGSDGFFHPTSENQIQDLILMARQNGLQVRVRGSSHSIPDAVFTDGYRYKSSPMVDIILDHFSWIQFNDEKKQVTVGGGARFARDPRDLTGKATDEAGLCYQLDRRGWALPVLAGVTHQTIAGFLATGSEGGSTRFSIYQHILSIKLIDGTGRIRFLTPETNPKYFYAAGVSLGLLGVIVELTLQCVDRYDVIGEDKSTKLEEAEVDFFSDGPNGINEYMNRTDYARFLWWPQPSVNRLVTWRAQRMKPEDYNEETGAFGQLKTKKYFPLTPILGSAVPLQVLGGAALRLLGQNPNPYWPAGQEIPKMEMLNGATLLRQKRHLIKSAIYRAFVDEKPRSFRDTWWKGLPQDNLMVESLLPTTFTEIFIPLSKAAQALSRLNNHFKKCGYAASGAYATEIYTAKGNNFWLSPAYGESMLRINFFWLQRHKGDPRLEFFPQFWGLLSDLGFRLHWAKLLFRDGKSSASYLRNQYPKWDEFMKVRNEFDPHQLFVNSYWRRHLGIEAKKPQESSLVQLNQSVSTVVRGPVRIFPLFFRLKPSSPAFAKDAQFFFDNQIEIQAPPDVVYKAFVNLEGGKKWLRFFRGAHWLTDARDEPGAVVNYTFFFMSMQVRVVSRSYASTWTSSVDACSFPLANQMLQRAEFEKTPQGSTRFRWRIFYNVPWTVRAFHPLARLFFARMFRVSTQNLSHYLRRDGLLTNAQSHSRVG